MKKFKDLIVVIILKVSITICLFASAYNDNYLAMCAWFTCLILAFSKTSYVFKFHVHTDKKIYTEKEMIDFGYDCFSNVYVEDNGDIAYVKVPEEILYEKEATK